MSTAPDLKSILKEIINKTNQNHIEDFLFDARPNEKKGIFLLHKINQHKGNSVFKDIESLKPVQDMNEMTYKAAAERYKNNSISSTYLTDYIHSSKFLYKNIFQERDIEQTKYSEILKPSVIVSLRNWLKIETCETYKDHVLEFLRGFYSTVNSNKKFTTINRNDYVPFKKHERYSQDQFFNNNVNKSRGHPYLTVEELRSLLKIDEMKKKLNELPPIEYNNQIDNFDFIEKKKKELIMGNKNILKGIFGNSNTTVYQENFKGQPEKFRYYFKPDIFTSGVKGKIPDPYMMSIAKNKQSIDEPLSFKITNMIKENNGSISSSYNGSYSSRLNNLNKINA